MTEPTGSFQKAFGGPQRTVGLLIAIILVSGIGIGVVAFFIFSDDGGDNPPPTAELSTLPTATWNETVTATATETVTQTTVVPPPVTAAPSRSASPPVRTPPAAPRPDAYTVQATIVGTCDEGGSCGVRQRAAPCTDAPSLYSSDLQDGMVVIAVCQTMGDVRSNRGVGSSNVWYRLNSGAYVSSVYMTTVTRIPPC